MRRFYVSEQGGIERFEPRVPPTQASTSRSVAWAVDAEHLVNYLVPRDCPRVCFQETQTTSAIDRERFLGSTRVPVVAIEAQWFERATTTPLWLYEVSRQAFELEDQNAGYYVSRVPAVAVRRRRVERPLAPAAAHVKR
jgi:hypothetical protein